MSLRFAEELLQDIDRVDADRSAYLERAARQYLYELHADESNAEAIDVLEFQTLPE